VNSLAASVVSHDAEIAELRQDIREVTRRWDAYLNTLPKQ